MSKRLAPFLVALCAAGCATPPEPDATQFMLAHGCTSVGDTWEIKVELSRSTQDPSAPKGVARHRFPDGKDNDPANLLVAECDVVRFIVETSGSKRSAMIAFDKDKNGVPCDKDGADPGSCFRSPGRQPAYLTRYGEISVPIDNRDGKGRDKFGYSIYVDCPGKKTRCDRLDPMIVVER